MQSKYSDGFAETAIDKIRSTCNDLFVLDKNIDDLSEIYNEKLRNIIKKFLTVISNNAAQFPEINMHFIYTSKGSTKDIHPAVRYKVGLLESEIKELIALNAFEFDFFGARELIELGRKRPSRSYQMSLSGYPLYVEKEGRKSYLALMSLREYYLFISDDGRLRKFLFDANVRDYQGNVTVNSQIATTLSEPQGEDFWWLNNGVSILTSNVMLNGTTLSIEDPQIVNGLQTSTEIFAFLSSNNDRLTNENRNLLVRFIVAEDEFSRDRIIKATNSQTAIPATSLVSTEKIHRDIEDYLKPKQLFYDRRKNSHKNQGIPTSKIISISFLSQAMMTLLLLSPDQARARPSTLLNKPEEYSEIFNPSYPLEIYFKAISIVKIVENFIKFYNIERKDINNIKWHLAMYAFVKSIRGDKVDIKNSKVKPEKIVDFDLPL